MDDSKASHTFLAHLLGWMLHFTVEACTHDLLLWSILFVQGSCSTDGIQWTGHVFFEKVCTHCNFVFAKLLLDKRVCSARVNAGGRSILQYILAGLAANENLSDGQSERAKSYIVDALPRLCDPNELEHGVITPSDHLMANCGSDEGVVSAFRFWTQALRDLGYELRSVTAPCETIATYVVVVSSTPHILPVLELTLQQWMCQREDNTCEKWGSSIRGSRFGPYHLGPPAEISDFIDGHKLWRDACVVSYCLEWAHEIELHMVPALHPIRSKRRPIL